MRPALAQSTPGYQDHQTRRVDRISGGAGTRRAVPIPGWDCQHTVRPTRRQVRMRLLLVEDDERVMAALTPSLRRHGFEVIGRRPGAGALEQLSRAPDVVLLDLGLPDSDGFQVCSRIRRVSSVPIIVTTARGDAGARVRGLNLGADDYVVKP